MGILFALAVYGLMLGGCAYLVWPAFAFVRTETWKQTRPTFWLVAAIGAVVLLIFSISEHTIAHWDRLGSWSCAQYFADELLRKPILDIARIVYATIETQEYTALNCLMTGALMRLIGDEYGKLILSSYILYLVPFLFCMALVQGRLFQTADKAGPMQFGYVFCAFFPPLLVALYNNPSDVSGLPIAGALAVAATERRWQRLSLPVVVVTAGMLAMLFILKRYYIFYGAACLGAYGLAEFIETLLANPKNSLQKLKDLVGPATSILGILVVLASGLALVFPGFFKRSFFNNYAATFTGHRYGDWKTDLSLLGGHFSWVYWIVIFFALFAGLRVARFRYATTWATSVVAIGYVGLIQVQSFDWNHYLILVPPILVLLLIGLERLSTMSPRITYYGAGGLILLNMGLVFVPHVQQSPVATLRPALIQTQLAPARRNDLPQLQALASFLNELTANGGHVYMLSSSEDYNEETISASQRPDILKAVPALYDGSQHGTVDKKHNFPVALLQADFVVVGDPIQYHIRPEEQRLVGLPAEQLLSGEGIGASYKLLKSFDMGTGVRMHVFKKTAPWPKDAKAQILGRLKETYPGFPKMYEVPYQAERYAEVYVPPGYATVQTYDNDFAIYVHPPDTGYTRFSINLTEVASPRRAVVFTPTFKTGVEQCASHCGEVRLIVLAGDRTLLDTLCRHQDKPAPITLCAPAGVTKVRVALGKGNNTDCCDWFQMEHIEIRPY